MTRRSAAGHPGRLGEPVIVQAEKLVGGGRTLAHLGGATWMVAGALPGEKVAVIQGRRRAGIREAEAAEVVASPHPAREPNPCPQTGICGGCDWPHVAASCGAPLKAMVAAEAARGHPELAARLAAAPVVPSPAAYRLRARLHWQPNPSRIGFFERRSHVVAEIGSCRVISPALAAAIEMLSAALAKRCPVALDLEWIEDNIRGHAVVALRRPARDRRPIDADWIPRPHDVAPGITGFHALDAAGCTASGWGPDHVTMDLPIPLEVPIGSFFQGNRHLIRVLFEHIGKLAGPDPMPTFDLHAGVGYLAAAVRSASKSPLTLIEPHRSAARAACRNLPGASVAVGSTAEHFLEETDRLPDNALVLTDPPRTGLSPRSTRRLAALRPRRLLMLGCDPATWARDASELLAAGYRLGNLVLFDLFPHTHHVEVVADLERE